MCIHINLITTRCCCMIVMNLFWIEKLFDGLEPNTRWCNHADFSIWNDSQFSWQLWHCLCRMKIDTEMDAMRRGMVQIVYWHLPLAIQGLMQNTEGAVFRFPQSLLLLAFRFEDSHSLGCLSKHWHACVVLRSMKHMGGLYRVYCLELCLYRLVKQIIVFSQGFVERIWCAQSHHVKVAVEL